MSSDNFIDLVGFGFNETVGDAHVVNGHRGEIESGVFVVLSILFI